MTVFFIFFFNGINSNEGVTKSKGGITYMTRNVADTLATKVEWLSVEISANLYTTMKTKRYN